MSRAQLIALLLVLPSACTQRGPASREGLGAPFPSIAAARAVADSVGVPVIIVVDTLVLLESESPPSEGEAIRVRLVRGNRDGCMSQARVTVPCPSTIFIETRRPQWKPR